MTQFTSPYNFVPLAEWVYCPEWAELVSHDVPFADAFSGELRYTLVADSPLLVGGRQEPASATRPGEVHAFRMPDGRPAVPGASLQGMLRAVTEILTFSRMRQVDDLRFALRDLSGTRVKDLYSQPMKRVEAGFLKRQQDGRIVIEPCEYAYVAHADLHGLGIKASDFSKRGASVRDKETAAARTLERTLELRFTPPVGGAGNLPESALRRATEVGSGKTVGRLVVTTQISQWDQNNGKGKKFDFVFYARRAGSVVPVESEAWRDFLWIHDGEEKDRPWPGYWKEKFFKGEEVPVFYLPPADGVPLRFGLARMFRLAGRYSVCDAIADASEDHIHDDAADFSDLLFGRLGGDLRDGGSCIASSLKGRLSFPPALASDPEPKVLELGPTVLSSPKPSFFPAYLEQAHKDAIPERESYRTWDGDKGGMPVRIRGWKRYLLRPDLAVPPPPEKSKPTVQVKLFPLETGARFDGRIVFHNLRAVELGAVLWAMTLGGTEGARHSLGMGKPFGLGQVHFEINEAASRIVPNRPGAAPESIPSFLKGFLAHMEQVCPGREGWRNSQQVASLLGMATIGRDVGMLRYPSLENSEFQNIKNSGLVLPRPPLAKGAVSLQSEEDEVAGCKVLHNSGRQELEFLVDGKRAFWRGPEAKAWVDALDAPLRSRLKKEKLTARVRVERTGNEIRVVSAEAEMPRV
ncbi:MAG TPA: TIGR03986 family CRISPR-associated RAMP protein [Xanthomonadaceae bacterium]|nr:TIGR03986 family CRISPR-associated RAMP protein [Xanthomonadaceae bacterium]